MEWKISRVTYMFLNAASKRGQWSYFPPKKESVLHFTQISSKVISFRFQGKEHCFHFNSGVKWAWLNVSTKTKNTRCKSPLLTSPLVSIPYFSSSFCTSCPSLPPSPVRGWTPASPVNCCWRVPRSSFGFVFKGSSQASTSSPAKVTFCPEHVPGPASAGIAVF